MACAAKQTGTFACPAPDSIAFAVSLIADIDSPRWEVIRVTPQNLLDLQRLISQ
ncbi:hypothetical protein CBM2633_A70115 [Cupriavidus taiwanensis]|nr:hypothetical protein CBM2633_A70115 [Cupriavidus taiwanensis]